jgi:hypothetical protein
MSLIPDGSAVVIPPAWQPETPFLGTAGAEAYAEFPQPTYGDRPMPPGTSETEAPFLAEYRLGDEVIDFGAAAAHGFAAELFDGEFDEALEELLDAAEAEVERLGADETPAGTARAKRLLERWIEPLRLDAEAMVERMAANLETERIDLLGEAELEELLDRHQPPMTDLPPVFEKFLDEWRKKLKRAVHGAAHLAKRGIAAVSKVLPIGILLRKLKPLVQPLLKRMVNLGLDKLNLPPAVRPYAAMLARRFTGEVEEPEQPETAAPASADVHALQLGFDTEITGLFFAPGEVEQEDLLAQSVADAGTTSDTLAELDDARSRFVTRIASLGEGEDPTPLMEEFLPALLPALRIGIQVVGRPKVVSFLARYLGRLIAPYVGPQITPVLSQAIVDAGLRLLTLETAEDVAAEAGAEPTPRVAGEAFANVMEDTVRRVCELSDEELEDELALEMAAYEGFQEAVAASFPAELLDPSSEYLETRAPTGVWVSMPRGGRARYRKFPHVFPVTITPQVAKAIRTFGGKNLYSVLRDRAGRTGVIHGRLHLYQAVPGSRVGRILRAEHRLGRTTAGRAGMHPLTREAAGLLLNEPGLGREVAEAYLDRPEPLAVGERLYYLEVPGASTVTRRSSGATLALDLRTDEIRLALYLGESDAQAIAVRLRRKEPLGASLAALRRIYSHTIRATLANTRRSIRMVHEEPEQEEFASGLFQLARSPLHVLANAIQRWVTQALGAALTHQRDAFLAATAADADGVTLLVRLTKPPGLRVIATLLRGGGAREPSGGLGSVADLRDLLRGHPRASVDIRPGHRRA